MSKLPMSDLDNPEWTEDDFRHSKPVEALPAEVLAFFPNTRGPQKAAKKVPLSIRLSPDVVEHFKATGPGWQARIDAALRKAAGL